MPTTFIDTGPLRRALVMLREALFFWHAQEDGTALKPHLRSAVIQSFEFSIDAVMPGAEVRVFGSRATGRARGVSDLELLFVRPARLTLAQRAALRHGFDSSTLPYMVDLVEAAAVAPGMSARIMSECRPILSRLLEEVEAGHEVVITRAGRPVARLTALHPARPPRRLGALAGRYTVPEDWDAPLPSDVMARFAGGA